jgi:prepilin-type N-terminal cleavage/methylation domain-containing protein
MQRSQKIKNYKSVKGFTIIEVMIVLVIGVLILLIVFLAIPQLRRSVRDTHRKNYANLVVASANAYISDAGGLPLCVPINLAALYRVIYLKIAI